MSQSFGQMQIKMDTDKSPRKRPKSKKLVRRKVKRERKPDTPMIKIHEPLQDKDSGSEEVFFFPFSFINPCANIGRG